MRGTNWRMQMSYAWLAKQSSLCSRHQRAQTTNFKFDSQQRKLTNDFEELESKTNPDESKRRKEFL